MIFDLDDLENIVVAAEISSISHLVFELQVLPVLWPPYWNLRHTVTLSSLAPYFPVSMLYKTIVFVAYSLHLVCF